MQEWIVDLDPQSAIDLCRTKIGRMRERWRLFWNLFGVLCQIDTVWNAYYTILLSISHKIWCEFDSAYFWRFVSSLVIDFRSGDIFMAAHNIASKWNSFSLCPNQDIPCHSISTLHPPSFSLPLHLHRWDDNSVNVWHTAKARPISNMSINWNKIILKFERLPTRNMKSRLKVNSKYPKKTQIFG